MRNRLIGGLVAAFLISQGAAADGLQFSAYLSGAQEVPAVTDTEGRGRVKVKFDKALTSAGVHVKVRNLTGNLVGAHFHCGLPGTNGPVAFGLINPGDLSFDGKRIRGKLDNGDFTGADCSGAVGRPVSNIAALAFAMEEGLIYLNLHTDAVPSGEIRGQMMEDDDDDDDDDKDDKEDDDDGDDD
jgi:hypothetical protein